MAASSETLIPIRKMKRSRTPQAGLLAALLILAGAIVWAVNGKGAGHAAERTPLRADFETVWSWSEPEFAGGAREARWSFRWDGEASLKVARSLASGLGFKLNGQLAGGDTPVDVVASDPAYRMTLWVHSRQTEETAPRQPVRYDIVLLLEAAAHAEHRTVADTVSRVERNIGRAGGELRGGLTVKGISVRPGAGTRIAKTAVARQAEVYDDGHTSSLTYYTPALRSKVDSGSQPVNLQIAEAPSEVGKAPELILGVPLITGDYALQEK